MQLLERNAIIRTLEVLAEEATDGRGRVVCLVGEAGIGKSSVALEVANLMRGRMRIFWGACEDLSTPAPLAPLYDFARIGNWRLPQADDRASRLISFSTALSELSRSPTLAVLEDLHWADDATADFVRYIARRIAGTQLLLLTTARDETEEAQNRLRRALADVMPESLERIELPRLSEAAVRQAAKAHGRDGSAVFALTSGNPFLTMEVLRGADSVPSTVRDALLWRADKLPTRARFALNAASLFPRRVERRVLHEMCGEHAESAIAACIAEGLLVSEEQFYAFKHEIARRAIEEALPGPERRRLNADALRILLSVDSTATARLVHHAIEADDAGAICELAPRAGVEAAEAGAHREAYRHYATALVYADHFEETKRAELLEKAGYELQLIGRLRDAIASFQSALDLRRRLGNQIKTGDVCRWLGRLHYNIGDRAAAHRLGQEAIDILRTAGPTYELAMAYANMALLTALQDESETAIKLADKALDIAQLLGLEEIIADAHGTLGAAKQWLDQDAAREHYRRGLAIALALNRPELVARIYNNGGNIHLNMRAHGAARQWLEQGIDYCIEHDLLTWTTYMQGLLAELFVRQGDWTAARELAQRTLQGDLTPVFRFPASVALARLNVRTGEPVARLFENLAFDDEPQRRLAYAPIFGEYAWVTQTDKDKALRLLDETADVASTVGNTWAAGEIAYWQSKLGGAPPIDLADFAPPYQLLFSGEWKQSADAWLALNCPYDAALALLHGDRKASDEALRILDSLGATATAARARKELRERGVRGVPRGPRSATQRNKAGLTTREMEVLLLLAQGQSNIQIAGLLSTAVKTVDHHVSAILGKLQSASRHEAVTRARQMGLVQ